MSPLPKPEGGEPGATLGWEVVVRFYPGAEAEARRFFDGLEPGEQAAWTRLARVTPAGEARDEVAFRLRGRP